MKKTAITFFTLMLTASTTFAQSIQTEIEIQQEAFGLDKKVAIANAMHLGDSDVIFWNIYDEYEAARKTLGKERIDLILAYADSYPDITDEQIVDLSKKTAKLRKSFDELQKTYFKKISKKIDIKTAAQFTQLESYFNAMILADIYSNMPFVGELKDNSVEVPNADI